MYRLHVETRSGSKMTIGIELCCVLWKLEVHTCGLIRSWLAAPRRTVTCSGVAVLRPPSPEGDCTGFGGSDPAVHSLAYFTARNWTRFYPGPTASSGIYLACELSAVQEKHHRESRATTCSCCAKKKKEKRKKESSATVMGS
jgi:hypothetical protein